MKFLATKDLRENVFLKNLIAGLLVFIILFLGSDLLLHHLQIGLTFSDALSSILGDEEAFIEPILLESLVLTAHIDLFFSMLLLLCLTAISTRVSNGCNPSKTLFHSLYISAILAPVFLIIGYFLGAIAVKIWVVLFIIWHLLALYLCFKTLFAILKL